MINNLTAAQKAAAVLIQLDDKRVNAILRELSDREVVKLMAEVAALPTLSDEVMRDIALELTNRSTGEVIRQGGLAVAEDLLRERFGDARAKEILDGLNEDTAHHPLEFLNQIDASQVAGYLDIEHPQTQAIVIAHLQADNAARVMQRLSDQRRGEVARRIAKMEPLPHDVVRALGDELVARLASFVRASAASASAGGIQAVVGILNNTDRATEKAILAQLDEEDPETAEQIRNSRFVFDDLVQLLGDQDLQLVLRNVPVKTIALSLKGKDRFVFDTFVRNLSQRNAQDLLEDFETLGAQRVSAVEGAEVEIVRQARLLAEAGDITIQRTDDELVA